MRMKTKFKMEINDTPKTKIKISPAMRSLNPTWKVGSAASSNRAHVIACAVVS